MAPTEELLVVAKLINFKPMVELLVITDIRTLAFSTTGMELKVDISHVDVVRQFVEAKSLSNVFTSEQKDGSAFRFKITAVEDVPIVQHALDRVSSVRANDTRTPGGSSVVPPPYVPPPIAPSIDAPPLSQQASGVLASDFLQNASASTDNTSEHALASNAGASNLLFDAPEAVSVPVQAESLGRIEALRLLAQLRNDGILTADEFEAEKAKVLGS